MKAKKIGVIFLILIGVCSLVVFGIREFEKQDLSKYEYWIVDTEITDYEFIENGKMITVDWHSKKEVNQQVSVLDKKLKFGSPGRIAGRRFLVSYAARFKAKSAWNAVRDDFPILEQNYPDKGEHWREYKESILKQGRDADIPYRRGEDIKIQHNQLFDRLVGSGGQ